jgi:hypothetical protein
MTHVNEIQELKELWVALFPGVPVPNDPQWILWLLRHKPTTVRDALGELGVKFVKLGGEMTAEHMGRFASSVMNRMSDRHRAVTA